MDQSKDFIKLKSNRSIDINEVITGVNKNEKKKVARRRWAILAKALKSPVGSEPSSPTDEFSVRRISSFMLLRTQQLTSVPLNSQDSHVIDQITKRTWYKYSIQINDFEFFIKIGHRNRTFSAEDLMGFNNTGNICIWPSEETLSYYACSNLAIFKDKRVLELGGGMSCLAGLFTGKFAAAKHVTVTDGNKMSVENVQAALVCNDFGCPIDCKVLKWGPLTGAGQLYDVVLCADCLFFDDARADLIECLWSCLHADGLALIMAPQRGNTLRNFIVQSEAKGFTCKTIFNYNQIVWAKRLTLLDNCEADYWISQTRKYCDFCKCWITDNKPSVEFHEKGRRHQENVKKRLRHITKHSSYVQRESDKFDATIQHMENAAMAAYRKDIENNADLTSVAINKKLQDDNLALSGSSSGPSSSLVCSVKKLWNEAKTKEGKSYYFNIMTNETVWTPPKEGFASIGEQRDLADIQAKKQLEALEKFNQKEARLTVQQIQKREMEESARLAREKLKERRVVDDIPVDTCGPLIEPGKNDAYGRWQTIKEQPETDWQLPEQQEFAEIPVECEPEPYVKEFKEKTIESLGNEGSDKVIFKKRKIANGSKRNTRQRLADD